MIALLSDPKDHLLQLILRMQLSLSLKMGKQSKMKAQLMIHSLFGKEMRSNLAMT